MGNNTNGKFDDLVKETLSNYQPNAETGDWARMERMLDAAPRSVQFKWNYLLNVFIGIAVLGGAFLIYNSVSSSSTDDASAVTGPVTPPDNTRSTTGKMNKPVAPPPAINTVVAAPVPAPATENTVPTPGDDENKPVAVQTTTAVPRITDKKNERKKMSAADEAEYNRNQKVFGMGNEPVFGDMIDSSKGIVNETKEKESTKRAAKNTTAYPVGWNSIMLSNVNLDSLKKYREKKDTIK